MTPQIPVKAQKMRRLAAKLREDAADTAMPEFRRKLECTASELEEAAVDVESRAYVAGRKK